MSRKFIITEDRLKELLLTEDHFISIDNVDGFKHAEYHLWLYETESELKEAKMNYPEDANGFELLEDKLREYEELKEVTDEN